MNWTTRSQGHWRAVLVVDWPPYDEHRRSTTAYTLHTRFHSIERLNKIASSPETLSVRARVVTPTLTLQFIGIHPLLSSRCTVRSGWGVVFVVPPLPVPGQLQPRCLASRCQPTPTHRPQSQVRLESVLDASVAVPFFNSQCCYSRDEGLFLGVHTTAGQRRAS